MRYTQPKESKRFVDAAGINALAIAVGSAHCFYKEAPKLQIDLIGEINKVKMAALVLHGSSGIPNNQLQAVMKKGITKINLATEIQNIFMKSLQNELKDSDNIDLRQVFPKGYFPSNRFGRREIKNYKLQLTCTKK
jgi:fructose-bisphosphate aldolase class II/tagatose 1,6-diphosphate aldolase GatY/KbaY